MSYTSILLTQYYISNRDNEYITLSYLKTLAMTTKLYPTLQTLALITQLYATLQTMTLITKVCPTLQRPSSFSQEHILKDEIVCLMSGVNSGQVISTVLPSLALILLFISTINDGYFKSTPVM